MPFGRTAFGLRVKLVAGYAAITAILTLVGLLAGELVYARADEARARRVAFEHGAQAIASLAASSDEEGFSFVLRGDPQERQRASTKLNDALLLAGTLTGDPGLSAEVRTTLGRLVAALEVLRASGVQLFDEFERTHAVSDQRYQAYEDAVDAAAQASVDIEAAQRTEATGSIAAIRRTSRLGRGAVGLLGLGLSIVAGLFFGHRLVRPLVELRDAARAFGEGNRDVTVRPRSQDEVGQVAAAFVRMLAERQRLEAELGQAQKLEALGLVAGGVAHDFNNVLAVILSGIEYAIDEVGPAHPLSGALGDVLDAAKRGIALTGQLLSFSRPRSTIPRLLSVNHAVEALRPMLDRLAGRAIRVCLVLDPAAPTVSIDPSQLDQAVMNLVVNARDAMPAGGDIVVATAIDGHGTVLSVEDAGTGMDEATRARVFEPFFTTKEPGKGTGLGLATVSRIVRQAQGEIMVDSSIGQGTRFRLHFPAPSTKAQPERRPELGPNLERAFGASRVRPTYVVHH